MALKFLYGMNLGVNTKDFLNLCEYVARASGRPLYPNKPIVGSNTLPMNRESMPTVF